MTPNEPKKPSRHGKRAEGKTQTSITMSEELLARAKEAAAKDGRSLSNWLEQLIKKSTLLLLIGAAGAHLVRSPRDWSAHSLAATGKAGIALISASSEGSRQITANRHNYEHYAKIPHLSH